MRKTASYLNQLRRDVKDVLEAVTIAACDVDASAYDLSCIVPHDVVTDDETVKELYENLNDGINELKSQVDSFKAARDKYVSFFGINYLQEKDI